MPNSKKTEGTTVRTFSGLVTTDATPIKAKEVDGRYPDGSPSRITPAECVARPKGCRCKKAGTWGPDKITRYECEDCGFTTLSEAEAKSRNPALRS